MNRKNNSGTTATEKMGAVALYWNNSKWNYREMGLNALMLDLCMFICDGVT